MRPIDETEFEIREALVAQKHPGLFARAENYLSALKLLLQPPSDLGHLTARLRRDAGIDELEVERKEVAGAPLIR